MNLLKVDWPLFLERLKAWQSLPSETRAVFLEAEGGLQKNWSRLEFGEHLEPLLEAGFLERVDSGRPRVRLTVRAAQYRKLIQSLAQVRVFEEASFAQFGMYATQHFPNSFLRSLLEDNGAHDGSLQRIFDRISSREWIDKVLSLTRAAEFEQDHLDAGERSYFITPNALPLTQELIRRLVELKEPIPIRELTESHSAIQLSVILPANLRYLILFAALRSRDLEPVIGLWPMVIDRLTAPKPAQPAPVKAAKDFFCPFLAEDMTQLLIACSNRPLRLRSSDSALYSRDSQRIGADLAPLPEWLEATLSFDADLRLEEAMVYLVHMGFAVRRKDSAGILRFEPTEPGKKWLAENSQHRLKLVCDDLKSGRRRAKEFRRFLPWRIKVTAACERREFDRAVASAFLSLPDEAFYSFNQFAAYHRSASNPLLTLRAQAGPYSLSLDFAHYYDPSREKLESIWHSLLLEFLRQRLLPLGGVRVGFDADRNLCFAMTDIGRYLMGRDEEFGPGLDERSGVLIQPNFDIVFLTPAPLAEAEIGRFAQRIGQGLGTVFRITKESIVAAAGIGLEGERILRTLRDFSTKDIPPNVEREIEGWAAGCRRIRLRTSILIECPDPETAGRVASAGGKRVRLLSETVAELTDAKHKSSLIGKLKKKGIFLEL